MTKRSFRIKERALGSFLRATFLQKPARGERCAGVKFAAFRPAAAEPPPTSADGAVLPGSPGPSSSRTLAGPASPFGTSPGARPGLRGRRGRPPAAQPPQMRTRLFRVQNRRRAGTTLAPKIRRNTFRRAAGSPPHGAAPPTGAERRRRAAGPAPSPPSPGPPLADTRRLLDGGPRAAAGGAAHPQLPGLPRPGGAVQGHLAAPEGPRRLPRVHRPPGAPPATDARRRHRLRRGPGLPRLSVRPIPGPGAWLGLRACPKTREAARPHCVCLIHPGVRQGRAGNPERRLGAGAEGGRRG